MKKNKTMRIASVLLIAVLLTTCIISGTFAKYVTTGEASDEARVAKFGVVVNGDGSLFSQTYKKVSNGNGPSPEENDGSKIASLTVESSNGDKLVAPGTQSNGKGLSLGITGTPEVDVRIKLSFGDIEDVFLKAAGELPDMTTADSKDTFGFEDDYYPIVYTLSGDYIAARYNKDNTIYDETGVKYDAATKSVSGNLEAIKAVFDVLNNDGEGIYVDANKDLADVQHGGIGTFTLTWKWAFELTDSEKSAITDKTRTAATSDWDDAIRTSTKKDKYVEYNGVRYWEKPSKTQLGQEDYVNARIADALKVRDQQDTLLGDLAAGIVEIDDTLYNLNTNVAITVTVTQVD